MQRQVQSSTTTRLLTEAVAARIRDVLLECEGTEVGEFVIIAPSAPYQAKPRVLRFIAGGPEEGLDCDCCHGTGRK